MKLNKKYDVMTNGERESGALTTLEMTRRKDPRKCPAHNMWMRKGSCEICRMAADKLQQEREQQSGSNKPPIKIGKL